MASSANAARRATSLEAHLTHGGALTDELLDWTRPAGPTVSPVPPLTISPHEPISALQAITALVDTLSFVDAYIDTRPTTASELLEIDRFEPSADDETGYGLLPKPTIDPLAPGLAETSREGEIALEAGLLARWVFDSSTRGKLPSFASSPARPTTVELSAARYGRMQHALSPSDLDANMRFLMQGLTLGQPSHLPRPSDRPSGSAPSLSGAHPRLRPRDADAHRRRRPRALAQGGRVGLEDGSIRPQIRQDDAGKRTGGQLVDCRDQGDDSGVGR